MGFMVAKLVIEEGDLKGLNLSLQDDEDIWTVGRDPDECQLVIEDPLISRKHLILRRTLEGFVVENVSATHSLQINDEDVENQTHVLRNGDTLTLGNEVLRFYEDSSAHIVDDDITPEETEDTELPLQEDNELSPHNEALPEPLPEPSSLESEIPSESDGDMSMFDATTDSGEESATFDDIDSTDEIDQTERNLADKQDSFPQHTIFAEDESEIGPLAEIDFGIVETGRWLLKVIGGPNTGAEFHMQTGRNYTLGTDPQNSDIVFNDTSVSRQHAKISVSPEDTLTIEDLKSRNGILLAGNTVDNKQELPLNTIVTLGTTSFVVYDREGEMQTIISPLLPSISKVLQQEAPIEQQEEADIANQPESAADIPLETPPPETQPVAPKHEHSFTNVIILTAVVGLFALTGMGTYSLFKAEPVVMQSQENADELIQETLRPYSALRYTFNKGKNSLFLLGHVMNTAEKNQLLFNLQNLKFIKSIDDSGIIIDESVWHEVNSILSENPAWKGITIYSPRAGEFILSGYLETRRQAEQLSAYISLNFPYLDLLKKQIVVEEDVVNQINNWLSNAKLPDAVAKMINGEITLSGGALPDQGPAINQVITKIKNIPGVRIVNNQVKWQTAEPNIINISDHYQVTGKSRIGNKYTVVIGGRILSQGNDLDGMMIKEITANRVMLEKDGVRYRIDY